ncbi:MAG: nitroreductase [Clostridia bacterium]|nr:nitroreductase [Clostridia bacterium]
MDVIQAIRERHSVRNYSDKKIESDKVEALRAKIDEVNGEGNLHLQFLEDAGKTFNRLMSRAMGLGTAPSVIACVGPDDETLNERVGYYGEQVVLLAQQLGLNTCWAGTYSKNNVPANVAPGERLVIVIAIGYGKTQGSPRKSKTPEQVATGIDGKPEWFRFGVEMALLAPTAINQQKFEISLSEDGTVTFTDKGGVFSKVDLGIVRCHFEAGAAYCKAQEQ